MTSSSTLLRFLHHRSEHVSATLHNVRAYKTVKIRIKLGKYAVRIAFSLLDLIKFTKSVQNSDSKESILEMCKPRKVFVS